MRTQVDTIVAIATAPGRGAVGIVRLSGPAAQSIAAQLCDGLPPPRAAAVRTFRDAAGERIDQGLLLSFPGPASYTGEDVVELQGHGSPVVLQQILRAACALGARVARPGEFSERAFLNGKLDLAQAEAVADLIDAGSTAAARAAQRSLEGELSRRVHALVEELTQLRVYVEGALDFSDEDVDWLGDAGLRARIDQLARGLATLQGDADKGRRLRDGLVVTLTGRPNAGKSTLLNALSGRDAAIVTEIPGTTRDLLREAIDLGGLPVIVVDSAGLRETADPVEREGLRRARNAIGEAEVALYLVDDRAGVTAEDESLIAQLPAGPSLWLVRNKCDLSARAPERFASGGREHIRLSAAQGAGLDLLVQALREFAGLGSERESLFSARARHVDAIARARACVDDASRRLAEGANPELAAEELRLAQQALGEITGEFGAEDLLGRIFGAFCIGK